MRATAPAGVVFPQDLGGWVGREALLQHVQVSAARACGDSWMNLLEGQTATRSADDLLVLVCYCYLQGVYHSIDVVRRLDSDDLLASMGSSLALRPEQVRRYRREHRRSICDCLTHSLVAIWRGRHPSAAEGKGLEGHLLYHRLNFSFLEPFYLHAQDRVDRAVVLDSMALDY